MIIARGLSCHQSKQHFYDGAQELQFGRFAAPAAKTERRPNGYFATLRLA
jgi:hypothetical protein